MKKRVLTKEYYDKIKGYLKKDAGDEVIQEIINLTIEEGDSLHIYDLAMVVADYVDVKNLQDAIIATKDVYYICRFAADIKGADIAKLEKAVEKTGDLEGIIYFAKSVKGANIDRLRNIVKKSKNEKYIQIFAELVDNAPIIDEQRI